jgi:hypothetical protein
VFLYLVILTAESQLQMIVITALMLIFVAALAIGAL